MAKLLGVTLDYKLSWSKHIDTIVAKRRRIMSIIKRYFTFLTALSTRQVLQALVLFHLDNCSVVSSGATKTDLGKLQLAQNRAARLALGCTQRANREHVSPDSKWRRDWLLHHLYLWEILTCWIHRAVCLNYRHTAGTPTHTPQDMPPEVSSQSPSQEQTMGSAQYYI